MSIVEETPIAGCVLVRYPAASDERGSFARAYSDEELHDEGIEFRVVQANLAGTAQAGTVRGLHLQVAPYGEQKLMRCVRGSVFDVLVDLRTGSPTYGTWHGVELTERNNLALLVPKGCAHGYMTLESDAQMLYFVDQAYAPTAERVVSAQHEDLAIRWPREIAVQSAKDAATSRTAALPSSGYAISV